MGMLSNNLRKDITTVDFYRCCSQFRSNKDAGLNYKPTSQKSEVPTNIILGIPSFVICISW